MSKYRYYDFNKKIAYGHRARLLYRMNRITNDLEVWVDDTGRWAVAYKPFVDIQDNCKEIPEDEAFLRLL